MKSSDFKITYILFANPMNNGFKKERRVPCSRIYIYFEFRNEIKIQNSRVAVSFTYPLDINATCIENAPCGTHSISRVFERRANQ